MAISIRRIMCAEAWEKPEWPQIMKEYGEEVQYPGLEPSPDREMYERLESAGVAQFVGAFDGDRLVGIAVYCKTVVPRFKGPLLASSDALWVAPEYRKAAAGLRLIRAVERFAKEDGCAGIFWGVKKGTRAEALFARLATPLNTLFWKPLR